MRRNRGGFATAFACAVRFSIRKPADCETPGRISIKTPANSSGSRASGSLASGKISSSVAITNLYADAPGFSRMGGSATHQARECGSDLPKLTNSTSTSRVAKQSGQLLLNHREQQHHPRGDDRERIASARQAAEALFTPKRQAVDPSASASVPSAERPARKPRVLSILSPAPVRNEEVATPANPDPRTTRQVPRSHMAAWRAGRRRGAAGGGGCRRPRRARSREIRRAAAYLSRGPKQPRSGTCQAWRAGERTSPAGGGDRGLPRGAEELHERSGADGMRFGERYRGWPGSAPIPREDG
jgi:hypothetical protein